jgi:hypothetical protein
VNGGPIDGVEYSVVLRISFHEIFLHAWIGGSVKESFYKRRRCSTDWAELWSPTGRLPAASIQGGPYYIELCFPTKLNNVGLLVILVCGDMVMDDFERKFVDGSSNGDLEDKFGLQAGTRDG